jgi:hypothetical protein
MADTGTPSPVAISATAARLSIAAMVIYHLLLVLLIFLRPDLDPSWHTISEWAIGPHGWLMTAAFLISASSYAALCLALRSQLPGALGRIGLGLLAICVLGTVGVGLFTTDPMRSPPQPLSTTGRLHIVCGGSALLLLPFAALSINLGLAFKNPAWHAARRVLLGTAGVPLAGFLAFVTYTVLFVVPLGPDAHGPGVHIGWPPRVAFWSYAIWLITLASQALRVRWQAA